MSNILVTGSSGMIARELIEILQNKGHKVTLADIKTGQDLTDRQTCMDLCWQKDEVYHLAGVKGNPRMTKERPVDFMEPMLKFDTQMITAAQRQKVPRFLYTSSIAVMNPEDDKFPAWAKMTGENLIEAMRIQYPGGTKYCVVRPGNVYGRYDNFDNKDVMVVTSLVNRAVRGDNPLVIWGSGANERDFINSKDVAEGMIKTMEQMPAFPVNLGSGKGYTIKQLVNYIVENLDRKPSIEYDLSKGVGTNKRVLDNESAQRIGFTPSISLSDGIREVVAFRRAQWSQ